MNVDGRVSYSAVSEAYCLLTSYLREEGEILATYDKVHIQDFVVFLAEILRDTQNFRKET